MSPIVAAVSLSESIAEGLPDGVVVLSLVRARQAFEVLEDWLLSESVRQMPLHEVEQEQERRGREIQRLLLEAHVASRGNGDVGSAVEVQGGAGEAPVCHSHRWMGSRHPQTVFGEITVQRLGYAHPGRDSVFPLDEQVHLPARSFSYEVQRRVVKAAVQGPFEEAVERVEESTGVRIPKRSAQELVEEAACDFEAFYQSRVPPAHTVTGPLLVGTVDGKGVPMKKSELTLKQVRRGKGEKAQKKKMAVVAAVYTQQPRIRTPQEVIESLFEANAKPAPAQVATPRIPPEHKRVFASLVQGKAGVIGEMAREMARRDPMREKQWMVLTDGERALQTTVKAQVEGVILILDFQHALSKLWQAAYVFHAEGSKEAQAWVQQRALRLLQGGVSAVIQGMRQSATKAGLSDRKKKPLEKAAAYFYRNRAHMRYDEYLRQGFPIATGVVEGACKHLVKDRMEQSGMRWVIQGAEAMLKLRAIYLSGDFDDYWAFHLQQDQKRLHPSGLWQPVQLIEEK